MDEMPSGGKLISLKKLEANRRNAQLSTGPRTERGKRHSRRNSLKHGVLASALLINDPSAEDFAGFQKLLSDLDRDLAPVGKLEEMMVERIAACWWRLQRALRFEAEAITRAAAEEQAKINKEGPPTSEEILGVVKESAEEAAAIERDSLVNPNPVLPKKLHWVHLPPEMQQRELTQRLKSRRLSGRLSQLLRIAELRQAKAMGMEAGSEPNGTAALQKIKPQATGPVDRPLSLPAEIDLSRILKYEANIHRQLAHAMNQLERLQRARRGENVPPPVNVSFSADQ